MSAIKMKNGTATASLDLGSTGIDYKVHWFDPRKGGELQSGSVSSLKGEGITSQL